MKLEISILYKREVYPILYFVFVYIDVFVTQLHVSKSNRLSDLITKQLMQSYLAKKFSWRFNIQLKYFQGT